MNPWMSTTDRVLSLAIRPHTTTMEAFVVVLVGTVVLLLVTKASTAAAGASDAGWLRRLVGLLLMLAILVGSTVVAIVAIAPQIHSAFLSKIALFVFPLAASLIVGIPIMGLALRTRYAVTFISAALSLSACVITMMAVHAAVDSLHGGNTEFTLVKRRTHGLDQFMKTQ